MLSFQAQPAAVPERAALTGGLSVQKISRVELYTRLGRADLDHSPATRVFENRGKHQFTRTRPIDHPVVIVAVTRLQLIVGRANPASNGVRPPKVEGGPRHRPQLTCRDHGCIHRSESVGIERQHVVNDRAPRIAAQIEIRVIGEIDGSCLGSPRPVLDLQRVVVPEKIIHMGRELSGKPLLPFRTHISKTGRGSGGHGGRFVRPDAFIEAVPATVQGVRSVVLGQLVRFAVQSETPRRDAIGKAPHTGAKIRNARQVGFDRVESQNDVLQVAGAVGRLERHD